MEDKDAIDFASVIKNNISNSIELTDESGEAYDKIHDIFKDIPSGKVGFANLKTGDVKVLGDIDQQIAYTLYEENQFDSGSGGTSHIIKYSTIYDMINSEPSINFGLTLHSELPVAYGYRFQQPAQVKELYNLQTIGEISEEYWAEWARYINLDHILKMAIHSLKAMGVVYIEKTYDAAGMNRKGWGIRKMRVLSPDAMYVVVDSKGNILGFIQWAGETERKFYEDDESIKQHLEKRRIQIDNKNSFLKNHQGSIFIPRHKIIFATYNAYYDDTVYGYGNLVSLIPYSKSKIGIQKRVLRMIENSASSFVVFKYGTENYMIPGKAATKVMNDISSTKNPKYIAVPFYFDVQTVDMGGAIQTVAPVMDYFKDEQMTGLAVPMILLRPGGSGEGAKVQLEAFTRQMKYMQNIMSNLFRTQCFPEALLGDPTRSSKLVTDDVRLYPYIRPSVYHKIPELKWNTIESVADRRLRLDVDAKHGAISLQEYRQEIGRMGEIMEGDEMPLIRLQYEQIEMQEEQMKLDQETTKMQMDHDKEMVDKEMERSKQEINNTEKNIEHQGKQLEIDSKRFDLDKKKNAESERSQKVKDQRAVKNKSK